MGASEPQTVATSGGPSPVARLIIVFFFGRSVVSSSKRRRRYGHDVIARGVCLGDAKAGERRAWCGILSLSLSLPHSLSAGREGGSRGKTPSWLGLAWREFGFGFGVAVFAAAISLSRV